MFGTHQMEQGAASFQMISQNTCGTFIIIHEPGRPIQIERSAFRVGIGCVPVQPVTGIVSYLVPVCQAFCRLKRRIRKAYEAGGQIVIYGKNGHAEVVGLVGQTEGTAIVIESLEDAKKLDLSRDIQLFSQTTKSLEGFREIVSYIEAHMQEGAHFQYFDTICRQVANRIPNIMEFASKHDVILFVCGKKSSNGKVLYNQCLSVNSRTYMIDDPAEIDYQWFEGIESIGICGATSTPKWLMEDCKKRIEEQLIGTGGKE